LVPLVADVFALDDDDDDVDDSLLLCLAELASLLLLE
jgi:hypothetical protein